MLARLKQAFLKQAEVVSKERKPNVTSYTSWEGSCSCEKEADTHTHPSPENAPFPRYPLLVFHSLFIQIVFHCMEITIPLVWPRSSYLLSVSSSGLGWPRNHKPPALPPFLLLLTFYFLFSEWRQKFFGWMDFTCYFVTTFMQFLKMNGVILWRVLLDTVHFTHSIQSSQVQATA